MYEVNIPDFMSTLSGQKRAAESVIDLQNLIGNYSIIKLAIAPPSGSGLDNAVIPNT